ncbi:mitochondrial import receptor subunit TOM7 homolog [Condylostylus longicornis]|uniref:mitochondrial import receptor subunit TOM7 homolog n=1 Tax=Condylostylus longicornis TaxID=2530218 RepID=UPI00244E08C1|nr:mitochondrial import receptor subunit TOM7 homolog [Condylostylus longicornis]XP_055380094.1 mitochondrial import receptor subunit TOM7 homolog [Condylostylus longicornis]XP_055380095.1 mitochondrial import receptor subunit TOM7 homolog [Condylostylus longicornis]
MELSSDAKERLGLVFEAAKTVFHWGFIPTVIYLGFQKGPEPGMPGFTLMSLLWQ